MDLEESSSSAASSRQREVGGESRLPHTPTDSFIYYSLLSLFILLYILLLFTVFNSFTLQDFLCA